MRASDIIQKAALIVGGDRERTHGDKWESHKMIAAIWSAYLGITVTPKEVAVLLNFLKAVRDKKGEYNPDDFIDMAGYAGIAGELAARQREEESRDALGR